ncbi:MAG: DUF1501 domain-containing protein, partial [Pirellulales bacterium]
PVAQLLAREADKKYATDKRPKSIIVLWLAGGPSQLETFDPHPGTNIAAGTKAIGTAATNVQLAADYPRLAEQMASIALVRSVTSKEGDHERGTYTVKTGYRPAPGLVHPTIGAVCCHAMEVAGAEIPRHVSILPGQWPAWGGFLGSHYDAFKIGDPARKVPDVASRADDARTRARLADLDVVESEFARRRAGRADATLHRQRIDDARRMMTSEQLAAFDVMQEPSAVRAAYGDTPFGRGCLAARRLTEVGVRCVEVTLGGWDSHAKNHESHRELAATLDPAFAALIADLKQRGTLERTIILCGGEFGRTPRMNPLGGRDHWPHGFTIALAGGGLRGGVAIGETDPEGGREVRTPQRIEDIHATILTALGLDIASENDTAAKRPIKLSEGTPIRALFDS